MLMNVPMGKLSARPALMSIRRDLMNAPAHWDMLVMVAHAPISLTKPTIAPTLLSAPTRKVVLNCACQDGFAGDGVNCLDVDECTDAGDDCSPHATCVNNRSFTCQCNAGFSGDGQECDDIDECATDTHDCDAWRAPIQMGRLSASVLRWRGDGQTCEDIDECADDTAGCDSNAVCTNTPGAFTVSVPTVGLGHT